MSDLFKSAMGYFNTATTNASDNDFVGQIVEVGAVKLRVKRVIAEGWCIFSLLHRYLRNASESQLLLLLLLSWMFFLFLFAANWCVYWKWHWTNQTKTIFYIHRCFLFFLFKLRLYKHKACKLACICSPWHF